MGKRIHSLTFMDCERIFTMGKFLLLVGLLAVAIVMVAAGSDKASAAKPDNPGCFGTDRALFNNTWIRDLPDPGSSWWGMRLATAPATTVRIIRRTKQRAADRNQGLLSSVWAVKN
jgi:hypothetical protein